MENSKGLDNTKENDKGKTSLKWKTAPPPPVRQTLTSYKRMLKANPLLKYQEAGIDIEEVFKTRGTKIGTHSEFADAKAGSTLYGRPSLKEFKKPETKPLMRSQSLKVPKCNGLDTGSKKFCISGNRPVPNSLKRPPVGNVSGHTEKLSVKHKAEAAAKNLVVNREKTEQKRSLVEIKAKVNSFPKQFYPSVPKFNTSSTNVAKNPEIKCPPKKISSLLRRSFSADHIESKKGKTFHPKPVYTKLNQSSQSQENLIDHESNVEAIGSLGFSLGFSPIMEEYSRPKNLVFKTPSAYDRRSVSHFTPRSVRKSSQFLASTPAPIELQRLQERLNKWLKSRGKPLASFHHLRCFGVKSPNAPSPIPINDDENKENVVVINGKSESFEDLKIGSISEINKPVLQGNNDIPEEELSKVAKEAMVELQKLIEEDYPRAQCLGWLELIREKYKKAVDEPEYWECRAAIEQSLGNVGNAVEFYKTAIIQGAEVTTVDKSLDQLLKKFSLLNISPSKSEQNIVNGNKERIVREARTVFKSTIIQFAIQERKLKKKNIDEASDAQNSKKLVATPVRRSTRMSRSAYVTTPGVTLCTSLKEINLSMDDINFEKNKALC